MNESWYSVHELETTGPDEIAAESKMMPDSLWFSGHFPGKPILPGIAQLSMIYDLLRNHKALKDKNLKISEIKKVRFKQVIEPNDLITINIILDIKAPLIYKFKLMVKDEIACKGIMILEQI